MFKKKVIKISEQNFWQTSWTSWKDNNFKPLKKELNLSSKFDKLDYKNKFTMKIHPETAVE